MKRNTSHLGSFGFGLGLSAFGASFLPAILVALSVLSLLSLLSLLSACGSDNATATNATATKLDDSYRRLGDNFGGAVALIKSSATTAGSIVPADFGAVAHVPKEATGGVDITVSQKGKSGEKATNIDGIGGDETVSIFVPDAPASSGTSASLPSFAAWKGDADSNDTGLCYLGFTKGSQWFVVSKCGDTSGAWVCQVASDATSCNACSAAGNCTQCDTTQSTFTCAW